MIEQLLWNSKQTAWGFYNGSRYENAGTCKELLLRDSLGKKYRDWSPYRNFSATNLVILIAPNKVDKFKQICTIGAKLKPEEIPEIHSKKGVCYFILTPDSFFRANAFRLDALYSFLKSSSFSYEDLQASFDRFCYKGKVSFEAFKNVATNIDKLDNFGGNEAQFNLLNSGDRTCGMWAALSGHRAKEILVKFA